MVIFKSIKRLFTFVIMLLMLLVLIGCDDVFGKDYHIEVFNPYDAPVSVEIFGIKKEIQPYDTGTFIIEDYYLDHVNVSANGRYFLNYFESLDLLEYFDTYHRLDANIGWYCLQNNSSYTIKFAKYNNSYFMYDGNQQTKWDTATPPGSEIYLRVDSAVSSYGQVTFYIGYDLYKFSYLTQFPELGNTRTIYLYNSTSVQLVN